MRGECCVDGILMLLLRAERMAKDPNTCFSEIIHSEMIINIALGKWHLDENGENINEESPKDTKLWL